MKLLKAIVNKFDINPTILALLSGKFWGICSYPITLLLLTKFLTPVEQGYYYAFLSLLGLDLFLELGLTSVLTTLASHEWPSLEMHASGKLAGCDKSKSRIMSLGKISLTWYGVASFIHFFALSLLGGYFLSGKSLDHSHWLVPWVLTVGISSLRLSLVPLGGLLQGCGQISTMSWMQSRASIIQTIIVWVGLSAKMGLYIIPLSSLAGLIVLGWTYGVKYNKFIIDVIKHKAGGHISWKREVFPLQWRIALSCASGYFIFQFQIPVVFHFCGEVEAGKYGATLAIITSLTGIASAWASSRVAEFGAMLSQRRNDEVVALARRCQLQSLIILLLSFIFLWFGLYVLSISGNPRRERFSTNLVVLGLMAYQYINTFIGTQALVVRASRKEPYFILSLIGATLIAIFVPISTFLWGSEGAALVSAALGLILLIPSVKVYRTFLARLT